MKITKEELELFGDGKGNIDIVALLVYRMGQEKLDAIDHALINGNVELALLLMDL